MQAKRPTLQAWGGGQQIGEQRLVVVAGEEARQFPAQPRNQALGEFLIIALLQPVQHQRAEQYLAPCVLGPILLAELCLQGFTLGFELGYPFLDRAPCHSGFLPLVRIWQYIAVRIGDHNFTILVA